MAEPTAIDPQDRITGESLALRSDGPTDRPDRRAWRYLRTKSTGRIHIKAIMPNGHEEDLGYVDVSPASNEVALVTVRVAGSQTVEELPPKEVDK